MTFADRPLGTEVKRKADATIYYVYTPRESIFGIFVMLFISYHAFRTIVHIFAGQLFTVVS